MGNMQPYSVEQVANLLGLHVKTVRNYVRDGKLKAVRIGKQYRITRDDLEAFTGQPVVPETVRRHRAVEVSSVVQVDAISREQTDRLSNALIAAANSGSAEAKLRVETIYDEVRASLKIIVIGGVADTAALLAIVDALTKE
ncbi:helix-turn-helix domain-containing protein [Herbidospora galbida]|uniref:Helix-turn-helix domain-containing protein n=2 Tax=Herbidospora galbida TaxID=2575442 RepID=A0A4U3MFQ2_9ACTN|nr:helix-turn-helix domain-containing protein [Herbidospora galbida]